MSEASTNRREPHSEDTTKLFTMYLRRKQLQNYVKLTFKTVPIMLTGLPICRAKDPPFTRTLGSITCSSIVTKNVKISIILTEVLASLTAKQIAYKSYSSPAKIPQPSSLLISMITLTTIFMIFILLFPRQ